MSRFLLVVLHAQPLGGLENHSREIAFSLRRLGHDVAVISALEPRQEYPDWDDIPIEAIAPRNPLLYRLHMRTWRRRLADELRTQKSQFDRVFVMHPYAAIAAHRAGIIDYWVWTYGIEVWGGWPEWLALGLKKAQRILAISTHTADAVRNRLPQQRLSILYPVIDDQRFVPVQPPREPSPPFRLLTVGRLSSNERYKGHETVIHSLGMIRDRLGAEVEYWIVGDGDDRMRLEQIARHTGMKEHVQFFGRVSDSDLLAVYQNCDAFVMPSVVEQRADGSWAGEGFGIVYLEASACCKPVIGSNVGGALDAIEDGVTGYCINPKSAHEFVDVAVRLLSDPELMQKMGRAGRHRVEAMFSLAALDQNMKNLLELD